MNKNNVIRSTVLKKSKQNKYKSCSKSLKDSLNHYNYYC